LAEDSKLLTDKDIPFGTLNPMLSRHGPGKSLLDLNSYSFLQSLKSVVKSTYTQDSLSAVTEFKGIVLSVLNPEAFSFFSILNKVALGDKSNILKVVVRVPEIHSHLPLPRSLPDREDYEILALYPVFEGTDVVSPVPGDVVRVTFQNIANQSGPVYLGKVIGEGNIGGNSYSESGGSKSAYNASSVPLGGGKTGFNQAGIEDVGFIGYDRRGTPISQLVIHESISATKEGAIRTLLNAKDKKTGESRPLSVHFIVDTNGSVSQHLPLELAGVHADGNGTDHNIKSIGVEFINLVNVVNSSNYNRTIEDVPWVAGHRYVIPPANQLESCWQLVQRLCSGGNGVLTLQFPACQINGNSATFYWGRWGGSLNANGVMAHCRWGHSDGLYIEHYCLARFLGFSPSEAATVTNNKAQETRERIDTNFGPNFGKKIDSKRTTTITKGKLK